MYRQTNKIRNNFIFLNTKLKKTFVEWNNDKKIIGNNCITYVYWKTINRSPIINLYFALTSYFPVCCIFWRYFSSMAACILLSRIWGWFFSHYKPNTVQSNNKVTSLKLYLLKDVLPIYHVSFFFFLKDPQHKSNVCIQP